MPGPVSDSFDPEFGAGEAAGDVRRAVESVRDLVSDRLRSPRKNIVAVARGPDGPRSTLGLTERELRVLRFALERALESL